jgi:hypothetical protein
LLEAMVHQWELLSAAAQTEGGGPLDPMLEAALHFWAQTERTGPLAPADEQGSMGRLTGADVYYLAVRALAGPDRDKAKWDAAATRLRAAHDDPFARFGPDL